jgi:hypothetical protein
MIRESEPLTEEQKAKARAFFEKNPIIGKPLGKTHLGRMVSCPYAPARPDTIVRLGNTPDTIVRLGNTEDGAR